MAKDAQTYIEPKATVISILPYEIYDKKPGLYPGDFIIPAGNINKPGLLEVGHSVFYVPMAFGAQSLQARSSPFEMANSIVNDYVGALLGISDDCKPGIFVANQEFDGPDEASVLLKSKLIKILEAQRRWFVTLVNLADFEFNAHHNAQSISQLQKLAARELNLQKPWLLDITQLAVNNCPACFNPVNTNAIICGICKYIIDPARYDPKKFVATMEAPKVTA